MSEPIYLIETFARRNSPRLGELALKHNGEESNYHPDNVESYYRIHNKSSGSFHCERQEKIENCKLCQAEREDVENLGCESGLSIVRDAISGLVSICTQAGSPCHRGLPAQLPALQVQFLPILRMSPLPQTLPY